MSYFTWKENGLTSDCMSLDAMARRYEEAAKLLRRMGKEGFTLKLNRQQQFIVHDDKEVFYSWGFISEEVPYKQLELIKDKNLKFKELD